MATRTMKATMNDLWWLGFLQGGLAVFFGLTAIFWPKLTLLTVVYMISGFLIGLGFFEVLHGILGVTRHFFWWLTIISGIVYISFGIYFSRHLKMSLKTLLIVLGIGLIIGGLLDLVRSVVSNSSISGRVLKILAGVAAVVVGIIVLVQPVKGGVAFMWIIGLYAMFYGVLTLADALTLRTELALDKKEG
jgi:uncharacterized membrane protein HdeD (DUF308 family)